MKLLFACLCACTCFFPAQGKPAGDFVNVAKYGAVANDGKDDAKALRKAVEYCRTHPGSTLYFPPGVYRLKDDAAVRLEEDVLAGKFGGKSRVCHLHSILSFLFPVFPFFGYKCSLKTRGHLGSPEILWGLYFGVRHPSKMGF